MVKNHLGRQVYKEPDETAAKNWALSIFHLQGQLLFDTSLKEHSPDLSIIRIRNVSPVSPQLRGVRAWEVMSLCGLMSFSQRVLT